MAPSSACLSTPSAAAPSAGAIADAALVMAARAGRKDAFVEIVTRYQPLVCAVAYQRTGNFQAGEDVAQETFVTAWRKIGELRDPGKLRAWLLSITGAMAVDHLRRDKASRREPLTDSNGSGAEATADRPDEAAVAREEEALVWSTLESLPESCRLPLILHYREGRSTAQIASALEVSEEAVRQRLSRGRELLREKLTSLVEGVLCRRVPSAFFVVAVAGAIGALTAPAAVAAGAFSAGAPAAATSTNTGALFVAVKTSRKTLAVAAALVAVCIPAFYFATHSSGKTAPDVVSPAAKTSVTVQRKTAVPNSKGGAPAAVSAAPIALMPVPGYPFPPVVSRTEILQYIATQQTPESYLAGAFLLSDKDLLEDAIERFPDNPDIQSYSIVLSLSGKSVLRENAFGRLRSLLPNSGLPDVFEFLDGSKRRRPLKEMADLLEGVSTKPIACQYLVTLQSEEAKLYRTLGKTDERDSLYAYQAKSALTPGHLLKWRRDAIDGEVRGLIKTDPVHGYQVLAHLTAMYQSLTEDAPDMPAAMMALTRERDLLNFFPEQSPFLAESRAAAIEQSVEERKNIAGLISLHREIYQTGSPQQITLYRSAVERLGEYKALKEMQSRHEMANLVK